MDVDYINRKQQNCSKFTQVLVSKKGDNIDWDYKSNTLDINEMWEELNRKIKSIILKLQNSLKKKIHEKYHRIVIGYLLK